MDWGGGAGQELAPLVADLGRIQAQGTRDQAHIWGGTLANLGNLIAQAPQRQALEQERQARTLELKSLADDHQLKVQQAQREQAGSQALAQAISDPANGGDTQQIYQKVAAAGFPEHAAKFLKVSTDNAEAFQKLGAMKRATADREHQDVADALEQVDPSDTVALHSVLGDLSRHGIDPSPWAAKLDELGAEQGIKQIVASAPENVKNKRAADLKRNEALTTPIKLEPDESLVMPGQNGAEPTTLAKGLPKQATGLEKDDQRYETIQQQMGLKQPVSPEDRAWAQAYERRKTLGPEATAAAAADRQAATIAQQTAQQGRAQSFAESQAGRKELTEKVEQPYQDAVEKASTLRSVIDAAKNGNMEAANVQSLMGTLGLVTMEGVKRINTTELNQVAGAGSLLERIKSQVGGMVSGKPLSPRLQDDLTQLSNLLEQSARKKYESGFQQVTSRYGLKDEHLMPADGDTPLAAAGPQEGATKPIPGYPGTEQTFKGGKWIRTK